jgi:CRISPR/Cas system-associated exonuclease Cas4 (RecB family)
MESLKHFEELLKEAAEAKEARLRFGAKLLSVSELAEQYYCEKKVELKRLYGEEETLGMKLGKEAHEALLKGSVKIKLEELWRKIYLGRPVLAREMPLLGKHSNMIIAGVADAVFFYGGLPIILFEHKFSTKPIPFRDHHVQARLYCYLLHLMGCDTSKLRYALILAPPSCREDGKLKEIPLSILRKLKEEKFKVELQKGLANIYVNKFNLEEAVDELDWALSFWANERTPKPTTKKGKCVVCEFNKICEYSLHG